MSGGIEGATMDFGARIYDARIGKFMSVDPWEDKYSWQSPYAYFKNSPISQIDWNGFGDPKDGEVEEIGSKSSTVKTNYKSEVTGDNVSIMKTTTTTLYQGTENKGNMFAEESLYALQSVTTTIITKINPITGSFSIESTSTTDYTKVYNTLQYASVEAQFSAITGDVVNTLSISGNIISVSLSELGQSLNGGLKKYPFGSSKTDFWYGKPNHVSVGLGINEVPSSIKKGNFARASSKAVNWGGAILGIGFSLYDYNTNSSYGSGMGGKATELSTDIGFSLIGTGGLAGFFVSSVYATRIKPVLKAGNAEERYNTTFSARDGDLRMIRDAAKKQENAIRLKEGLIKFFNE